MAVLTTALLSCPLSRVQSSPCAACRSCISLNKKKYLRLLMCQKTHSAMSFLTGTGPRTLAIDLFPRGLGSNASRRNRRVNRLMPDSRMSLTDAYRIRGSDLRHNQKTIAASTHCSISFDDLIDTSISSATTRRYVSSKLPPYLWRTDINSDV